MNELDKAQPDMRLEVVLLGTSNIDRMKSFFEKLGWRLDIDMTVGDFRGVQLTPHNSEASIILVNTITPAPAQLLLAVNDIDAARNELLARGVDVSEVFHFAAGPFNTTVPNPRVAGRDPENRPYFTF